MTRNSIRRKSGSDTLSHANFTSSRDCKRREATVGHIALTLATHQGCPSLWKHFVAKKLEVRDATKTVRKLVQSLTLQGLFRPELWPHLGFFALVEPDGDILPVRTLYSDTGETNIGLNPLISKSPIWFAGPDLAASVLLAERKTSASTI